MDSTTLVGTARTARAPASFITRFRRLAIWLALLMLGRGLHLSLRHGYPAVSLSPARADSIQYISDELGRLVPETLHRRLPLR